MAIEAEPLTISEVEAGEIRELIPQLGAARQADHHIAQARLRRIGYPSVDAPTLADFERLVDNGAIVVDRSGRARVEPHPSGRVFRVAVGVTGHPVESDWSAFSARFQWFGQQPRNVASGDHLFVLAVDRWRSAVVGLYEAVSAGAQRLPDSPDPNRWPWALGVRPLAAVPPPEAVRVDGQIGPQSGLPVYVYDQSAWPQLYSAVATSPPPPGPSTHEQRVQEVDWQEVGDDIVQAVHELGQDARAPAVLEYALQLGEWADEELAARAWYTGTGDPSHVRNVLRRALQMEQSSTGRISRTHGSGPFHVNGAYESPRRRFGTPYRPAASRDATQPDDAPHRVDLSALDAATARHMMLQDLLAGRLTARGIRPLSPSATDPAFDLAFEHNGYRYVVEVKSGLPVTPQQVRLGTGQILEYAHLLRDRDRDVIPALLIESEPPSPWTQLAAGLGIRLVRADALAEGLDSLTT